MCLYSDTVEAASNLKITVEVPTIVQCIKYAFQGQASLLLRAASIKKSSVITLAISYACFECYHMRVLNINAII